MLRFGDTDVILICFPGRNHFHAGGPCDDEFGLWGTLIDTWYDKWWGKGNVAWEGTADHSTADRGRQCSRSVLWKRLRVIFVIIVEIRSDQKRSPRLQNERIECFFPDFIRIGFHFPSSHPLSVEPTSRTHVQRGNWRLVVPWTWHPKDI